MGGATDWRGSALIPGRTRLAAVLAVGGLATAATAGSRAFDPDPGRFEFAEPHMGTTFRIVVFAPDSATAAEAAGSAFALVAELDARLSDYDPGSELSRLGEVAGTGEGRTVSPELWAVLSLAQEWAERTDGAFDVTVGPLTRLWRWSARRATLPDSARLAAARVAVGWRQLRLDPAGRVVRLERAGMALDLGGIAKGYAADAALRELERHGLGSALVDAGGDLALGAPPPGEPGWRIRVGGADGPVAILADVAVATSGDRYRYVEVDGVRYSHLVDPRTGLGSTRPATVTAIASTAATADVLASALGLMDRAAGMALVAATPGAAARIVGTGDETWQSAGFPAATQPTSTGATR